jgi:hypothetical protein
MKKGHTDTSLDKNGFQLRQGFAITVEMRLSPFRGCAHPSSRKKMPMSPFCRGLLKAFYFVQVIIGFPISEELFLGFRAVDVYL